MGLFGKKKADNYELDKIEKQIYDLKEKYNRLNRKLMISLGTKQLSASELKKYKKGVEELSEIEEKIKKLEKLERTIGMSSLINKSR